MNTHADSFFERFLGNIEAPYILAELGANHNGQMELAVRLINEARRLGCDGVKFQSWDERIFSQGVYESNRFLNDDYRYRSDHDLRSIVKAYAFDETKLRTAKACCNSAGIDFSSTPFELDQLKVLIDLDVPFVKVASMDLNNFPLLEAVGHSGKCVVLSTGFGTLAEIDEAIRSIRRTGNEKIILLHCISLYPPKDNQVNLLNIPMLAQTFGLPIGFSDHTLGAEAALAAAALGAVFIEKHFTLDKTSEGWDHAISADPGEMSTVVTGVRRIAKLRGQPYRLVSEEEMRAGSEYRRSVATTRRIAAGERLTLDCVGLRRPGTGISPRYLDFVLGMRVKRDLPPDHILQRSDLAGEDG